MEGSSLGPCLYCARLITTQVIAGQHTPRYTWDCHCLETESKALMSTRAASQLTVCLETEGMVSMSGATSTPTSDGRERHSARPQGKSIQPSCTGGNKRAVRLLAERATEERGVLSAGDDSETRRLPCDADETRGSPHRAKVGR